MLKVVVVTLCHRSWKSVEEVCRHPSFSFHVRMHAHSDEYKHMGSTPASKKTALSYRQSLQGLAYITVHGLEKNI